MVRWEPEEPVDVKGWMVAVPLIVAGVCLIVMVAVTLGR